MNNLSKLIPLLEKVKEALGVQPSMQSKASQNNRASTAAAKDKLTKLTKMSVKDQGKDLQIRAYGSKPMKK